MSDVSVTLREEIDALKGGHTMLRRELAGVVQTLQNEVGRGRGRDEAIAELRTICRTLGEERRVVIARHDYANGETLLEWIKPDGMITIPPRGRIVPDAEPLDRMCAVCGRVQLSVVAFPRKDHGAVCQDCAPRDAGQDL